MCDNCGEEHEEIPLEHAKAILESINETFLRNGQLFSVKRRKNGTFRKRGLHKE